LKTLVKNKII